jgi:hypothetical protein
VGSNYKGSVSKSYATGSVSGKSSIGGLVGSNEDGNVSNSYATGSVSGVLWSIGGLVGYNAGGSVTTSYYDKNTTGQSDTGKGTPKTTAEMKQQATFVDWDFDTIWQIDEGVSYPTLIPPASSGGITISGLTFVSSNDTLEGNGTTESPLSVSSEITDKINAIEAKYPMFNDVIDSEDAARESGMYKVSNNNTLLVTKHDDGSITQLVFASNPDPDYRYNFFIRNRSIDGEWGRAIGILNDFAANDINETTVELKGKINILGGLIDANTTKNTEQDAKITALEESELKIIDAEIKTYHGNLKVIKNKNIITLVGYVDFNYGLNYDNFIELTLSENVSPNEALQFQSIIKHSNPIHNSKAVVFEVIENTGVKLKLKFVKGFSTLPQYSIMSINWSWII